MRSLSEMIKAIEDGEEVTDIEFNSLWKSLKGISIKSKFEPPPDGRSFSSEKELKKYYYNLWAKDRTQEDIDSAREDLGIRSGKIIHLIYKGADGDVSERDIEIKKVEDKNGDLYILAFCHSSLNLKTFRKSRIISITHEGHPINDIRKFLTENLVNEALEDKTATPS